MSNNFYIFSIFIGKSRISKLLAMSLKNKAEIARKFDVSRARVTQITNLLKLHPRIQEGIIAMGTCTRLRLVRAYASERSPEGKRAADKIRLSESRIRPFENIVP